MRRRSSIKLHPAALGGALVILSLTAAVDEATAKREPTLEDPCTDSTNSTDGADSVCRAHAMDPFYAKLGKVQRGEAGAIARVTHFGDSIIAADYISATVREKLQADFGDAGRGFVYALHPTDFHATDGVTQSA